MYGHLCEEAIRKVHYSWLAFRCCCEQILVLFCYWDVKLMVTYIVLLYKHQRNTKWAFTWKLDISWHVKITCNLHMWKYHHCYGFIITAPFRPKNYLSKMVWYFIGVYIINRTLHGRLEIRNSLPMLKKIFHLFAALTRREMLYLRASM